MKIIEIMAPQWGRVIELEVDDQLLIHKLKEVIERVILEDGYMLNNECNKADRAHLLSVNAKGVLPDEKSLEECHIRNGSQMIIIWEGKNASS